MVCATALNYDFLKCQLNSKQDEPQLILNQSGYIPYVLIPSAVPLWVCELLFGHSM